jgi:hypothetical protein
MTSSRSDLKTDLANQLDRELTKMAIAQHESPEFQLLYSTPLTLERARQGDPDDLLRGQSARLLGLRTGALALRSQKDHLGAREGRTLVRSSGRLRSSDFAIQGSRRVRIDGRRGQAV